MTRSSESSPTPRRAASKGSAVKGAPDQRSEAIIKAIEVDRLQDAQAAVTELGLSRVEHAWRHLRTLAGGSLSEPECRAGLAALLAGLFASADPDGALLNLLRYGEARFGPENVTALLKLAPPTLDLLARLFGFSQFLADLLVRYPGYLDWLEEDPALGRARAVESFAAQFRESMAPFTTPLARRAAAIRCMRRELLRLGMRRMQRMSDEMTMARELSELAEVVLSVAIEEGRSQLDERLGRPIEERAEGVSAAAKDTSFLVVGMGKLGGRELNFSSDIDLLFVYSAEGETAGLADGSGRVSNHVYFTRLAEDLIAYLSAPSEEGYFYRVDMRLRPEGASGPLVRSLTSYEIYYETQAHAWERLALLKARGVAGDPELAKAFRAMSQPLVFNPLHTDQLVAQIADLKQRIDHEVATREVAGREVKRGAGGIREIEFLVQTLQMLQGARRPSLWVTGTMEAIEALENEGLLPDMEAEQMRGDYVFLRTIEHRLQMMQLRQTHTIPQEPELLDCLARRCGLAGHGKQSPGKVLMERWHATAERVHRSFLQMFEPDGAAADTQSDLDRAVAAILSVAPESQALPLLKPFGIETGGAFKTVKRMGGLGRSTYLTADGQKAFANLLPNLLEKLRGNPRPEVALAHLESFLNATGSLATYYATFLENPPTFELLLSVFGSASTLAHALIAHPEYLDYLAEDPEQLSGPGDRAAMQARLKLWTSRAKDENGFCGALVRFRKFEFLMAGLGEMAGLLDYETCSGRLSLATDLIVGAALGRAAERMGLAAKPEGFAVAAMGKLGAREINHHSDLDLIFVWDERFRAGERSPGEAAAELGERIIGQLTYATPEGHPFAVDARLRPEGKNAPLAPPLARYEEYYADRAQTWEFQSAMKLRPVAGDLELAGRLICLLGEIIARRVDRAGLAGEIRAMRRRMEQSLKNPQWVWCDFKVGAGGTVDLEFIAQYLQLRHLAEDSGLMGLGPLRAFGRLAERGFLSPETAEELTQNYLWMRRLERRVRMLFDSDRTVIPASGEKLVALERVCRDLIEGHEGIFEAVGLRLRRNRRLFEQILGGGTSQKNVT